MWKYVLALLIPVATFAVGYYYGSGNVVEKVTTIKGETRTVVKERVITRTIERRPDGTTVETVKEEDRKEDTKEKQKEELVDKSGTGRNGREMYRIGAYYGFRSTADAVRPGDWHGNVGLSASRRIGGPIWVDLGARPAGDRKEITVGLAVSW